MKAPVLLLASAAALWPNFVHQAAAQSLPASAPAFIAPDSPQLLTRTVWRSLSDDAQIVVRRRYAVLFTASADGFEIDGRLLDVTVEAPPLLAAMAELERKRADTGLFPMRLDPAGRLRLAATAAPADRPELESARKQAQALLATAPLTRAERQESSAFLAQLAAQGGMIAWPVDLFNPVPGERHETRQIALPDGQQGEIAIAVGATIGQPDGPTLTVRRTVTTSLAGSAQTSREEWTLAPAAPAELGMR